MTGLHDLRKSNLFRAAIAVPALITLIFSLFNLTAPLDPERLAGSIRLGIVNLDEGQRFPPINLGERLIGGLLAVFTLLALLVLLPVVFYQSVLSSAQVPVGVAPNWLARIGDAVPFDHVGAVYRSLIIGGREGLDPMLVGGAAAIGLALIWLASFPGNRG